MRNSSESAFSSVTASMVVDLLMQVFDGQSEPTPQDIEHQVDAYLVGPFSELRAERQAIVDELLIRIRVRIGTATTLDNAHGHVEWLPAMDRSSWRFWPRLEDYLRRADHLPPAVSHELDQSTDITLERLESPHRDGRWDRRGLVVGHVQSGKTTHYTTLMAKALDAGYEIIVVLAGIHNSLRSQTHERIDKYLIGRDSAALLEAARNPARAADVTARFMGVGQEDLRLGRPEIPVTIVTCTASSEDGDFHTNIANQVGFRVSPGSRLVMVVKKNATILRNLIQWLRAQHVVPGGLGVERRITAPSLIIDDEADHASINTGDPDDDPTTINRLIRRLLMSFDRVGFVGYTATPFANIFVPPGTDHEHHGPDLFPRSFIVNLKAPSDYIGPSLVFGHPGDESAGIPEQLPLPVHIPVQDTSSWVPDKHRKTHVPGPMPTSLREAIRLFVIVCAARACRGDENVHNSMLVHATRFVNVQARIAQQIDDEIVGLRNIVGSAGPDTIAALKRDCERIWQRQLAEPHPAFASRLGDRCLTLPSWKEVWGRMSAALNRIRVMRFNGESGDVLTYTRSPDGVYVIAVGGDKLSRGLTLEGLSISYFLRTSRMFDTLMQMGRWFGYRPRYADLCRVYTTPYLYAAFRQIALAMEELRTDLDRMARMHKDPETFGLRVRTPSDGLLITAANKIRRGEPVQVRFAGEIVQALEIVRTGQRAAENRASVMRFLESLGAPVRSIRGRSVPHLLWRAVPANAVLEFLGGYEAISTPSFYDRCDALRRYIREQLQYDELTEWTVVVISKQSTASTRTVNVGETPVVLVKRGETPASNSERFQTQGVVGSAEEDVDLNEEEYALALQASRDAEHPEVVPQRPGREASREARPATRGLLLLYLINDPSSPDPQKFIPSVAISFPTSDTARPLSYTVNEVWREQYGLAGDWNEDGQPI